MMPELMVSGGVPIACPKCGEYLTHEAPDHRWDRISVGEAIALRETAHRIRIPWHFGEKCPAGKVGCMPMSGWRSRKR
jgi:D-hexose-6-phosphate mutarotase